MATKPAICTSVMRYQTYMNNLHKILEALSATGRQAQLLHPEQGIEEWCRITHETRQARRCMYFVGNGASAAMASHMAADFSKNCDCRAFAFNDSALMTAISNDIQYEECFAMPLTRFASAFDMLITISSSGNSPNVTKAIQRARELDLRIITLSAMQADNKSRTLGDLNFWIPASTYGLAEAGHQALLHCWLDTFIELYGNQKTRISVEP